MHLSLQDYAPPSGDVSAALEKQFGSLDQFVEKFNGAAAGIQVHLSQKLTLKSGADCQECKTLRDVFNYMMPSFLSSAMIGFCASPAPF